MPDTYLPQCTSVDGPAGNSNINSGTIEADAIASNWPYFDIKITSSFVPLYENVISQNELYAPGSLTSWPENYEPQYRIPVTALTPVTSGNPFNVLTLAP